MCECVLGRLAGQRSSSFLEGVLKMKIGRAGEGEPESTIKPALAFQEVLKKRQKKALSSVYPRSHKCPYKAVIGLEGKLKRDRLWRGDAICIPRSRA